MPYIDASPATFEGILQYLRLGWVPHKEVHGQELYMNGIHYTVFPDPILIVSDLLGPTKPNGRCHSHCNPSVGCSSFLFSSRLAEMCLLQLLLHNNSTEVEMPCFITLVFANVQTNESVYFMCTDPDVEISNPILVYCRRSTQEILQLADRLSMFNLVSSLRDHIGKYFKSTMYAREWASARGATAYIAGKLDPPEVPNF
mgnify:CR=1 FL=1